MNDTIAPRRPVVVTGASSGIGATLARAVAGAGWPVLAVARREDRLAELTGDIERAGGTASAFACDLLEDGAGAAAIAAAQERYRVPWAIVHCVGGGEAGAAIDMPVAAFEAAFRLNVSTMLAVARPAARAMIDDRAPGRIVAISSLAAQRTPPGMAAYGIAKSALDAAIRALAAEWLAADIAVNAIAPGATRTEMTAPFYDSEHGRRVRDGFPRRRLIEPAAFAPLLLYLLSEAAEIVTGQILLADDAQGFAA